MILESELALCRELLKLRSNVHVVNTLVDMQYGLLVHSTKILSGRLNLLATQLNIVASIEVQAHLGSIEVVKFDSMLMQLFASCQPSQIGFYAGTKMV